MSLEELTPFDVEELFRGWCDAVCCPRWRLRGRSPDPGLFDHLMSHDVAYRRVQRDASGHATGILQVCAVNPTSRFGHLSFILLASGTRSSGPAILSFLQEASEVMELRKIVVQVDADVLDDVGDLVADLRPVGRLLGHTRHSPTWYEDQLVYELWT